MRVALVAFFLCFLFGAGCSGPVSDRLLADVGVIPSSVEEEEASLPVSSTQPTEIPSEEPEEPKQIDFGSNLVSIYGSDVKLPSTFPLAIDPLPDGSITLARSHERDGFRISTLILQTPSSKEDAIAWYETGLTNKGWTALPALDTEKVLARVYTLGEEKLVVTAISPAERQTKTTVTVVYTSATE